MKKIVVFALMILVGNAAFSQSGKELNTNKKKVAASGYDVVSYFNDSPLEGNSSISSSYNGAKYLFASKANKESFEKNPEKYAPQYGGWCAYAMGIDGSKVKIDPKTYKIIDEKLYLFYNFKKLNTLTLWNENESQFKSVADQQWAEINR